VKRGLLAFCFALVAGLVYYRWQAALFAGLIGLMFGVVRVSVGYNYPTDIIAGACLGFLWWNTSPARIIMGDTGALGLGGLMAGLAIATHTSLLLPIISFLFVINLMSVVIQIVYFRTTGGKRVFRMSPLHYHFELGGWSELNVVVRFWIIAAVSVAIGLGFFYGDFLQNVP
jgi:phospho-N-acetylmuramoyl-pentapeptide-transferase